MEQWGPTGVGALAVAIIGALGAWALKIWDKRIEERRESRKADLAEKELDVKLKREDTSQAKRERKDLLEEKDEQLDAKEADLKQCRAEIHDLRDKQNLQALKLELCEHDRKYLRRLVDALLDACRKNNIHVIVPVEPPPPLTPTPASGTPAYSPPSTPPSPKGGQ
jgi:septal ring factor EnvC (AmiA/AmiB activator)